LCKELLYKELFNARHGVKNNAKHGIENLSVLPDDMYEIVFEAISGVIKLKIFIFVAVIIRTTLLCNTSITNIH